MHAKSIRVVIHKESAAIEKLQLLSFPFFRHRFFISSIFAILRRKFQRDRLPGSINVSKSNSRYYLSRRKKYQRA